MSVEAIKAQLIGGLPDGLVQRIGAGEGFSTGYLYHLHRLFGVGNRPVRVEILGGGPLVPDLVQTPEVSQAVANLHTPDYRPTKWREAQHEVRMLSQELLAGLRVVGSVSLSCMINRSVILGLRPDLVAGQLDRLSQMRNGHEMHLLRERPELSQIIGNACLVTDASGQISGYREEQYPESTASDGTVLSLGRLKGRYYSPGSSWITWLTSNMGEFRARAQHATLHDDAFKKLADELGVQP
jgi:hypothetical protein